MIVVATNNGKGYLPGLVQSLNTYGTGGKKVLVVDTGSTDPESISYLKSLPSQSLGFDLQVTATPYRGYDTGAYIHAFRNYNEESYLFLQDSVLVKGEDWMHAFEKNLTYGVGCVPWLMFPMQWNSQEQIDWVQEKFNSLDWPPIGVFGPMFMASREAMDDLDQRGYLDNIPTCKLEQMAMERAWPTAFALSGWGIRPVETHFDEQLLRSNKYQHLAKRFAWRA